VRKTSLTNAREEKIRKEVIAELITGMLLNQWELRQIIRDNSL
jgi:hypothetical protein